MVGYMIGAIAFGHLSDRIGRKPAWMIAMVSLIIFSTSSAFMPEYWSHVICRLATGISSAGAFTISFVLFIEVTGPDKRVIPGLWMQLGPAIGYMALSVMAYLIKDYIWLIVISSLLSVTFIPIYWALSESPRWLLTHGKTEAALEGIHRIARINRIPLYPDDLQNLRSAENEISVKTQTRHYHIIDLLRTPNMRSKSLNICFTWFVISFTYYGLSIGTSDLAGSLYVNLLISSIVEIPGLIIVSVTINRLGRRLPLAVLLVGGGLSCTVIGALPSDWHIAIITLAMLGKLGVAGAFAVAYVYSAEVFPTVVRTIGVGAGSMCARIGGLVAPMVAFLGNRIWTPLPMILFGCSSIVAGLLCLRLPETLNIRLPETLEDGEHKTISDRSKDCKLSTTNIDDADEMEKDVKYIM